MERNATDELKAHLMTTNEEFCKLATQHSEYARKLDALYRAQNAVCPPPDPALTPCKLD